MQCANSGFSKPEIESRSKVIIDGYKNKKRNSLPNSIILLMEGYLEACSKCKYFYHC